MRINNTTTAQGSTSDAWARPAHGNPQIPTRGCACKAAPALQALWSPHPSLLQVLFATPPACRPCVRHPPPPMLPGSRGSHCRLISLALLPLFFSPSLSSLCLLPVLSLWGFIHSTLLQRSLSFERSSPAITVPSIHPHPVKTRTIQSG